MHTKVITAGLIAAVLIVASGVGIMIAARRQTTTYLALEQRLLLSAEPARIGSASLDDRPAPVARYLQWALQGRRDTDWVYLTEVGFLRTDAGSERWMSFTATDVAVPRATGFVWRARVAVAPLIHVRVRDAFSEGVGSGQVSILSAFTMAEDSATPEMNAGSLHMYLAEAVWYPTALLPSHKLRWSGLDDTRALATLEDHGVRVSLEFRFAPSGEVTGIHTPARWGSFDGGYRQLPWEGHFSTYQRRDGVAVPMAADVGWYVDGEFRTVWRGQVTGIEVRTSP